MKSRIVGGYDILDDYPLAGCSTLRRHYHTDYRGLYREIFNKKDFELAFPNVPPFVQDDISLSTKGVFRGIHGDNKTWKLITCLSGMFELVVMRKDFEWTSINLSESCSQSVLIPPGYGNGHLVISPYATFHYKQTTYYDGPDDQFTYNVQKLDGGSKFIERVSRIIGRTIIYSARDMP